MGVYFSGIAYPSNVDDSTGVPEVFAVPLGGVPDIETVKSFNGKKCSAIDITKTPLMQVDGTERSLPTLKEKGVLTAYECRNPLGAPTYLAYFKSNTPGPVVVTEFLTYDTGNELVVGDRNPGILDYSKTEVSSDGKITVPSYPIEK